MSTYFEAPDGHGEPTIWASEGNHHAVPAITRSDLANTRFWPDVVARMTGTTITNDDATVERVAQALWDITIPRWVTMRPADLTDPLKEQLHDQARAILAALTGVPHD